MKKSKPTPIDPRTIPIEDYKLEIFAKDPFGGSGNGLFISGVIQSMARELLEYRNKLTQRNFVNLGDIVKETSTDGVGIVCGVSDGEYCVAGINLSKYAWFDKDELSLIREADNTSFEYANNLDSANGNISEFVDVEISEIDMTDWGSEDHADLKKAQEITTYIKQYIK